MKIFLHIGSTKTGSSAIQNFCHKNRSLLNRHGVYYPKAGLTSSAHHLLSAALHPSAKGLHRDFFHADSGDPKKIFFDFAREILAEADRSGARCTLLSSEYLWGQFRNDFYQGWADAFSGADMQVIAVMRRQDDWIQSSYVQAVKNGESRNFADWHDHFKRRPVSGADNYAVLKGWSTCFNENNIRVLSYMELIRDHDICNGFLKELGLNSKSLSEFEPLHKVANPSPARETLKLILAVNNSSLDANNKRQLRQILLQVGAKRKIGASVELVPEETRRSILNSYAEQNAKILAEFDVRSSGNLFA